MPFDWRDFLLIAHELRNDSREGVQRTCLGRTYYYVYNLGLVKAKSLNFTYQKAKGGGSHKQLWDWCQKQSDPTIKQIGNLGNSIFSNRIRADYYDTLIPNLAGEVIKQLVKARDFEVLVAKSNGQQPPSPLGP